MSFYKYLKENLRLLIFYIILITFISAAIYLDRSNRMLNSNAVYILVVSTIMMIFFLIYDYVRKNYSIKKLKEIQTSEDKTPIFGKADEYKDELYQLIISDLYNGYVESLRNIEDQFMENSEFLISWVHEIKTPITTIKLILESSEVTEDATLNSLKEELDKIDDYVEKVLYYSRSNDFSKDYVIKEIALNTLIKDSIKKHSIIFIRKHISFSCTIDDKLAVDSDKKWLSFIIDQIISNALKYTSNGGKISFIASENEKEVILTVEDNGVGIKKEDLERIFSKSFTGNNGRDTNLKATGMGLYLSKKLAKKLGHYLIAESEYGKGTKLHVHFPRYM